MQPSLVLCRIHEARHRAFSRAAVLDNLRLIAGKAAAWAKEGVAAEIREDHKLPTRAFAQAQLGDLAGVVNEVRSLSKNRDRGYPEQA